MSAFNIKGERFCTIKERLQLVTPLFKVLVPGNYLLINKQKLKRYVI